MVKKIVLINGAFLTKKVTGVQRYAIDIISEIYKQKDNDYEFIVAVPNKIIKNDYGFNIIYDDSQLRTYLWQQLRLPLLVNRVKADILWNPCNEGPIFLNVPQIINIYDASVYAQNKWFDWKFTLYYKFMIKIFGKIAAKIITCSEFSKEELVKYRICNQSKIKVIYPSVSDFFINNINSVNEKQNYIISVGSIDPRKNIKSLIRAWGLIKPKIRKNYKLLIIGGEYKIFRKEKIKLEENIIFTGYLSDDELIKTYKTASLFVYPSFYEGFGIPPLEGMACGCPCVVSNAASLPEVCGDSAYYVNPYDVEDIARGIEIVLSDEKLRENLVKKGFENIKRFSWQRSAKEVLEIMKSL
jgi:glycosyltransferase involved in cell wall biosynthesis